MGLVIAQKEQKNVTLTKYINELDNRKHMLTNKTEQLKACGYRVNTLTHAVEPRVMFCLYARFSLRVISCPWKKRTEDMMTKSRSICR